MMKHTDLQNNEFDWSIEFPQLCDANGTWQGFDVVIGNPPYFSLQSSKSNYKQICQKFETYEASGDVYSLFIEKAIQLLKPHGQLSFIVSNRFCNTEYGKSTRRFLSKYLIHSFINSNDTNLFENANVGTLIFLLTKAEATPENKINILRMNKLSESAAVSFHSYCQNKQAYFSEKHWIFKPSEALAIKNKMETMGEMFSKNTDLETYRGITTGLNTVFVIDEKTKNQLIEQHPSSAEIIKPLLRGRNIQKYSIKPSNEWIVFTRRGLDIKKYPAIENYLLPFKTQLEAGTGRKKGNYKWFEIQDNTAYFKEFEKEKIIWSQISAKNHFAISRHNEYSLNSTFIATGKHLPFYCAILNSKAFLFYTKLGAVIWGKEGIKWLGDYFFQSPLPSYNPENKTHRDIENWVKQILELKTTHAHSPTLLLENKIDAEVYKLYHLTNEEIAIIETEIA